MNFTTMQTFRQSIETLINDVLMHLGIIFMLIFIATLYVVYLITGIVEICRVIMVMSFGMMVWCVCRGEFMIHRPASYVTYVEENISRSELSKQEGKKDSIKTYELWKKDLKNTWLLGALDTVSFIVLFFFVYRAGSILFMNGDMLFSVVMGSLIILSLPSLLIIQKMAGK